MGFYVLINGEDIRVKQCEKMLTLKRMQKLVGIEGELAYIEVASYRSYSDETISMICDDEFLRKGQDPTCYTSEGHLLHGQVLVLGTDKANKDFALLTEQQVQIVKWQTRLYRW